MNSLLRISDAVSLAIHAVVCLARMEEGRALSAAAVSTRLEVSEAHMEKVLQRLVHAGIVQSRRGPGGGFNLARPPDAITLREIFEVVDGPIAPATCLLGRSNCLASACCLGPLLVNVSSEVTAYLTRTRVSDVLASQGVCTTTP
jgi:Rrf2 family protein